MHICTNQEKEVNIFSAMGVEFCFGYGLTETANLTSANKDALTHPTSIGKIYPEQQARIDTEYLMGQTQALQSRMKDLMDQFIRTECSL